MPKYYCGKLSLLRIELNSLAICRFTYGFANQLFNERIKDYCDVYLTHDSSSVRKAHNNGKNHIMNVRNYYAELGQDKAQAIIDGITKAYERAGQSGFPPQYGYIPGMPPILPVVAPPFGGKQSFGPVIPPPLLIGHPASAIPVTAPGLGVPPGLGPAPGVGGAPPLSPGPPAPRLPPSLSPTSMPPQPFGQPPGSSYMRPPDAPGFQPPQGSSTNIPSSGPPPPGAIQPPPSGTAYFPPSGSLQYPSDNSSSASQSLLPSKRQMEE
ncbi:10211_t:CDS:2 [Acaulospora morrowiae]|uniref:U1 small nuclear ribonucleoprotein C n=1 Tax=Acaulospora morrowiae TaxID=94023 RepID=A0A9N8ZN00_9GLOM|nr:10211_t:CDS:2 [Acaulospora morrowiae]